MLSQSWCLSFYLLFLYLFELSATPINTENDVFIPKLASAHEIPARRLRAARTFASIKPRSISSCLDHGFDLHYLDESTHQLDSQFAARLSLLANLPTLLLEEIEHHLDNVVCSSSSITLHFFNLESAEAAFMEFGTSDEMLIVTSHLGCNNEGERQIYRSSYVSLEKDKNSVILSTTHSPWRDSVKSMTVDFGYSNEDFELRRHHDLWRRQDASSSIASIFVPTQTSSGAGASATSVMASIQTSWGWTNQQILPPNWPQALSQVVPSLPGGFTLTCKNCTIAADIDLLSGSLTMATVNSSTNDTENKIAFFEHGYVELQSNHFAAHVELETTIHPTKSLISYHAPFPDIYLPGFQIPGIAAVGPVLRPLVSMGVQISASLDFTYGFDVEVPNDSTFTLDINNITNSSVVGFAESKVTALPFEAHLSSIDLSLNAGFSPQLLLAISVLDDHGFAAAGFYLDMPSVSATVAEVFDVDSQCNPVSTGAKDHYIALTNIQESVEIGFGAMAEVDVSIYDYEKEFVATTSLLSTSAPLPTKCLSFDAHALTFGVPGTSTTTTSSSSAATGSGTTKTATGAATKIGGKIVFPSPLGNIKCDWNMTAALLFGIATFMFLLT